MEMRPGTPNSLKDFMSIRLFIESDISKQVKIFIENRKRKTHMLLVSSANFCKQFGPRSKVIFVKISRQQKSMKNYPGDKEIRQMLAIHL